MHVLLFLHWMIGSLGLKYLASLACFSSHVLYGSGHIVTKVGEISSKLAVARQEGPNICSNQMEASIR